MATTQYCSVTDVAEILGVSGFPATGAITQTVVDKWITQVDDHINDVTKTSWKSVTVSDEYHDWVGERFRRTAGFPVFLNHDHIFSLDTSEGDKLEVWDGTAYVDYLTDKTEGRADDFWVDTNLGIVYIKTFPGVNVALRIRVTYRYGNQTVPGSIKWASSLLTAARVARSNSGQSLLIEAGSDIPPIEQVRGWEEQGDRIITGRAGARAIGAITYP